MRWRALTKCGRCGKKGAYINWGRSGESVQCRYCKHYLIYSGTKLLADAGAALAGTWEDGVRGPSFYEDEVTP